MKLKIVLEPSEEGGYTAYVPALPGCVGGAGLIEEATANLREAIDLYLKPVDDDLAAHVEGAEVLRLVV